MAKNDYSALGAYDPVEVLDAAKKVINHLVRGQWDPDHMDNTPRRFLDALTELTNPNPEDIEKFTVFKNEGMDEMVLIKDIQFTTLCAHHVVPFMGKAHVAYIPDEKLCGLSKIPRAVRYFSKALTVQEQLTTRIADFLEEKLEPKGLAIVMEAEHMCMTIRGVQAQGTMTTTSSMRGVFADHTRLARQEFLDLVNKGA